MRKAKVKSSDRHWFPVPNNPRDNELYVDKQERGREKKFNNDSMIFGSTEKESRYGYRQTASGGWRERDEPSELDQLRQSDAINRLMQKRKALSGRERLKTKGAVPVRAGSGKKLFEEFIGIARQHQMHERQQKNLDDADMKNIYLSAQHLSYEKWIWFVNDEYGSRI